MCFHSESRDPTSSTEQLHELHRREPSTEPHGPHRMFTHRSLESSGITTSSKLSLYRVAAIVRPTSSVEHSPILPFRASSLPRLLDRTHVLKPLQRTLPLASNMLLHLLLLLVSGITTSLAVPNSLPPSQKSQGPPEIRDTAQDHCGYAAFRTCCGRNLKAGTGCEQLDNDIEGYYVKGNPRDIGRLKGKNVCWRSCVKRERREEGKRGRHGITSPDLLDDGSAPAE
ncbi:hypothetical protein CC78DRAFT_547153 [Lojkania enalia]|uniref:Uncharacterized protein n=1 Tax=Lojkania enalia TaxID=147567 RepID=A0A9P4N0S9_9PLEO|nr:hypothetical protein CC78DRAFT_547153 [Didymosphaeria enalia]